MTLQTNKPGLLKKILFPFAWLYGWGVSIRHFLFNKGILRVRKFDFPVVCVGNLSTGGTGKTPTVLYLLRLLEDKRVATLSRGYKRKTSGFLLASDQTGPDQIGDEPYLFHQQFPHAIVSVGEDRCSAIDRLRLLPSPPEVILLDDGFQHRKVQPCFSIILTDYSQLFSRDFFLPVGHLRYSRAAARSAQLIIVTKCPTDLRVDDKEKITAELQKYGPKIVLFSYINYQHPISLKEGTIADLNEPPHILLIHGIARANSLRAYVSQLDPEFKEMTYKDHHDYTEADIHHINANFQQLPAGNRMILTTQKDSVKLMQFGDKLRDLPIYILPIELDFLFQQRAVFDQTIHHFIENFKN